MRPKKTKPAIKHLLKLNGLEGYKIVDGKLIVPGPPDFQFFDLTRLPAKFGKLQEPPAEFWEKNAQPQLAAARQLLDKLALSVGELDRLPSFARQSVSGIELARLADRILRLIRANLEVARATSLDALPQLVGLTRRNCQTLKQLADDKRTHVYVEAVASRQAEWPVLLMDKKSSRVEAMHYLKSLSVGARTPIPNAGKDKLSQDDLWNQCAAQLIRNIEFHREVLSGQTQKNIPSWFFQTARQEAGKWAQVLKLPPPLNSTTRKAWWEVAKKMLEIELDAETPAAKQLLDKVKKTAAREIEKQRTIAIREVGQAFKKIARSRGAAGD